MLSGVKGVDAKSKWFVVNSVISGHVLDLKGAGKVRLAGLLYEASLEGPDFLTALLLETPKVKLDFVSSEPDRYGRKSAHIYLKDGRWVQGELVRQGLARAYPYDGENKHIRDLYVLESMARLAGLGHWDSDIWPIAQALDDAIPKDNFHMVEGMVVEVAQIKGNTYLNFGSNWRTDFTVMVTKKDLKRFRKSGFTLSMLKGRRLRVRGWVFERNGPMIRAEDPMQFQLLD